MAAPQRPTQQPEQATQQHQPQQSHADPFQAMQQHMAQIRQEALQIESCEELAAFLSLLGQAEAALQTLQGADQARKAEQADKERMVIGADDEGTDAPGHRPAGQSQPLPATGPTSSATMERDMRNVSEANRRADADKDKE